MTVRVLLFGPEAAAAGKRHVEVTVPHNATCASVKAAIAAVEPVLAASVAAARLAVNGEFAGTEQRVGPGDEVALIGMVSGG